MCPRAPRRATGGDSPRRQSRRSPPRRGGAWMAPGVPQYAKRRDSAALGRAPERRRTGTLSRAERGRASGKARVAPRSRHPRAGRRSGGRSGTAARVFILGRAEASGLRVPVPPRGRYLIIGRYFVRSFLLAWRENACNVNFCTKIKRYPNGSVDILCCEKSVFRRPGFEAPFGSFSEKKPVRRVSGKADSSGDSLREPFRAVRRAKARVRDIAIANDFDYFVTLTLDSAKVDRYDVKQITRKLSAWCDNQVRRYGLRYVLIPERHKDGALHFHGFMSWDGKCWAVESGTYTKAEWKKPRKARSAAQAAAWCAEGAKVVYNLPNWTLGFSTAIAVYGEYGAAVGYVCKYVGKQMDSGKIGGRWYYSGGKLRVPEVYFCNLGFSDLDELPGVYEFCAEAVGKMRLWRGTSEAFSALMGPILENRAISDFMDAFYPEINEKNVSRETFEDEYIPLQFEELGEAVEVPFL